MKALLLILFLIPSLILAQGWQWANQIGTLSNEGYVDGHIITDGENSYLIGDFKGSLMLKTDTFASYGYDDLFVIKYDQDGNELWAKRFGGYNDEWEYEIVKGVYDTNCNCIYLAGMFYGIMHLSPSISIIGNSFEHLFLAKIELDGTFLWGRLVDSSNVLFPTVSYYNYIFVRPGGGIIIAGSAVDTTYIDTIKINPGGFLALFDDDGNCKWAVNKFSGPENHKISISFIDTDILMGGLFEQNPSTIDTSTLILSGEKDGYVARMDSSGNVKWIKKIGGPGNDGILEITTDNLNNIYLTGYFSDSINIDGTVLNNPVMDVLIAKLDENGNLIWARQASVNSNNGGYADDILSDDNGNCYITGTFSGSASFGNYNVTSTGTSDMFLARYNNNGICMGINHFGSANGVNMAVDDDGNTICAGIFSGTVNIGNITLNSIGLYDVYIAKSDSISGVHENGNKSGDVLVIYANPTTGTCNIVIPEDFQYENNLTLSIYDDHGKLVQQFSVIISNDEFRFEIDAEAKGFYNIVLRGRSKQYYGKLIFE